MNIQNEIHVWDIHLDDLVPMVRLAESCLSSDERKRAEGFRFALGRHRWVVSHIALRQILAEYLNTPAHAVEFCTTKHGKPYLNNQAHAEKVFFSLTHTDRIALVAITGIAPIGVDAERIRPMPDLLEIANRFFHSLEARSLASVRGIERTRAFFRCWTRKEAILKANGTGLSCPLDTFQVSLLPEELSRLIEVCDLATTSHFHLFDIQLDAGYSASVAIEGKEKCVLKQFRFHNGTLRTAPDSSGHLDSSSMKIDLKSCGGDPRRV